MRGWLSLRSKPPEIVAQTQTTVVLQSANGDVNQFTQHRNICCDRGAYMNIRRHETVVENSSSIEKSGQESRSLLDDRNRRLTLAPSARGTSLLHRRGPRRGQA